MALLQYPSYFQGHPELWAKLMAGTALVRRGTFNFQHSLSLAGLLY